MDINTTEYHKYIQLEKYLFEDVTTRFHKNKYLTDFDFFCIIIWKANRAKSRIANKVYSKTTVRELTSTIYHCKSDKERFEYLRYNIELRMPTASAILTVLYPDSFTVFDYRVCEILKSQRGVDYSYISSWDNYIEFVEAVKKSTPGNMSLRNKDRYLWGISFYNDLINDINEWSKGKD